MSMAQTGQSATAALGVPQGTTPVSVGTLVGAFSELLEPPSEEDADDDEPDEHPVSSIAADAPNTKMLSAPLPHLRCMIIFPIVANALWMRATIGR
jgi:hypothetical protein